MGKDSLRERRQLFSSVLRRKKIDVAIVSNPKHVYYLTGYSTFWPRQNSLLVLSKYDQSHLFVGQQRENDARKSYDGEVTTFEDYNLKKHMVVYPGYVAREFAQFLKAPKVFKGKKTIGLEGWHLPHAYVRAISGTIRGARFVDITPDIMHLRATKGRDELTKLREATKRLEVAYEVAKRSIAEGKSEIELCRDVMSDSILRHGPFEFSRGDTWISGPRTLEVGGPPTDRRFRRGESIILDLQSTYDGYWADGARTYVVAEANENQRRLFEIILSAKKKAEALLKPRVKCSDVYNVVASEIASAGYSGTFPHHAGHGLGLEDQEAPFLIPGSKEKLEEGMVCTLEPGIYHPQIGGLRDEDTYLITAKGFEKLTTPPVSLECVG
ncbi:MAG TPA: Xaa-Pro peptidase family protein [Terriglobales bacterium]|nr:Xaa-Pro peptidase family protein [Terriglobales bacterium]